MFNYISLEIDTILIDDMGEWQHIMSKIKSTAEQRDTATAPEPTRPIVKRKPMPPVSKQLE